MAFSSTVFPVASLLALLLVMNGAQEAVCVGEVSNNNVGEASMGAFSLCQCKQSCKTCEKVICSGDELCVCFKKPFTTDCKCKCVLKEECDDRVAHTNEGFVQA